MAKFKALFLLLNFLSAPVVWANTELDQKYSLERIGFLKAWDNVDGLFADYVSRAYSEYFSEQSRFKWQDFNKVDTVLSDSKLPYQKIIEDELILKTLARKMRVETIIRTKVYKEGPGYRFNIDLIYAPQMDILSSHSFRLEQARPDQVLSIEVINFELKRALEELFSKLPFHANVNGRDQDWITVNIGRNARLKKGDMLTIATLENVKRHPLLKKIVDWEFVEIGTITVDDVEDRIAFCKVVEEKPGHQVLRYQKVIKIIPAGEVVRNSDEGDPLAREANDTEPGKSPKVYEKIENPKIGWVSGGFWMGGYHHEYSAGSGSLGREGGSFAWGGRANGQIWFNREWFGELGLGYATSNLSQKNTATGTDSPTNSVTANFFKFDIDFGYSYLVTGNFFGPKGWIKLGYHSVDYDLPALPGEYLGSSSVGGLFIGVGGDIPVREGWGLSANLDFGLLKGYSESGFTTGAATGVSDFAFQIGPYFWLNPRMAVRGTFEILSQSAQFSGGQSVSHRIISVIPSLAYYF